MYIDKKARVQPKKVDDEIFVFASSPSREKYTKEPNNIPMNNETRNRELPITYTFSLLIFCS
jgi:hypothetical protein